MLGYQFSVVTTSTSVWPLFPNAPWLLNLKIASVLLNLELHLVLIVQKLFLINLLADKRPANSVQMEIAQKACTTTSLRVSTEGKKEPQVSGHGGLENIPC